LPPSWKPAYHEYREQIVNWLVKSGIIAEPNTSPVPSKTKKESPELIKARQTLQEVIDQVKEYEQHVKDEGEELAKDFGPEWEWRKLGDECVEKEAGE
jgi:hypothetical protein